MLSALIDFVLPRTSLTGEEGVWITAKEKDAIERSLSPLLLHGELLKKQDIQYIDAVVAATTYGASPLLRTAIHTFKYRRIAELSTIFSAWMKLAIPGHLIPPEPHLYPVLCPVPLHWSRVFLRGFNQSKLLADAIATTLTWDSEELLIRTRPTGHQARRGRAERLQALTDAFAWKDKKGAIPPWVVLVDDVCTTGTTLNECAKALKAAGVKHVSGLVLAYG